MCVAVSLAERKSQSKPPHAHDAALSFQAHAEGIWSTAKAMGIRIRSMGRRIADDQGSDSSRSWS